MYFNSTDSFRFNVVQACIIIKWKWNLCNVNVLVHTYYMISVFLKTVYFLIFPYFCAVCACLILILELIQKKTVATTSKGVQPSFVKCAGTIHFVWKAHTFFKKNFQAFIILAKIYLGIFFPHFIRVWWGRERLFIFKCIRKMNFSFYPYTNRVFYNAIMNMYKCVPNRAGACIKLYKV